MSGTALDGYIAPAFQILNVFQAGASIGNAQAQQAFLLLNNMVSGWAQSVTFQTVIAIETFDLVANQGGLSDPYTIGDGGDFDTTKPPNQNSITGATLVLRASSPYVEVPLALLTDDMYQAMQIKELSNSQPTCLYYQANYSDGLGRIYLWPVPNTTTNALRLYWNQPIGPFANLSATSYTFPDGWDEALIYNLAKRLAGPNGRQMMPSDDLIARESLANIQRANAKLCDMRNDMAFNDVRGGYNINTGTGG